MKKQLLFLLFALLALCASAAPNDVFSVGDITYSVTLDSYSGKPGIVAVKSLSAQGKAKTSLKLDIPGVVSYNGYKYKVGVINYDAFKRTVKHFGGANPLQHHPNCAIGV